MVVSALLLFSGLAAAAKARRHQVYSFSSAKTFSLKLSASVAAWPE
jgi:hypothetical protein